MASNYSVDDILEEVRRKKAAANGQSVQPQAKSAAARPDGAGSPPNDPLTPARRDTAPRTAAPFRLTGLTGEFEASPRPAAPELRPAQRSVSTRVDLPAQKASGQSQTSFVPAAEKMAGSPADTAGATRVMPAVGQKGDDALERRRQEKVRQFMESSFASLDEEQTDGQPPLPDSTDDAEEPGAISISQFFGGLGHSAISTRKTRPAVPREQPDPAHVKSTGSFAAEDEIEEDEEEYSSPADAPQVRKDIVAIRRSLTVRIAVTGVCFGLLLYLALCNLYQLPLLNPICPEVDMRIYLSVNLVVLLISALASNTVIGSGLISLFTFHADHDTPAALCTLAVIAHGVALIVSSDYLHTGEGGFYFCVAALGLLFNAIGKRMMIVRIERNFAVASIDALRTGECILRDDPFAAELTEGQDLEEPAIAYPVRVHFPEEFLRLSYTDDYSENMSRIIAPLFLLFGAALGLMAWLAFEQSAMGALTIFSAVLCMASPLTPVLIGNLPLLRAASKLSGEGAFISGYDAVEQFEEMNTVAVDACELYPPGTVVLHGIKAFAQSRIDEAILDAASVMCKVDGLLKDIFLDMIGQKTDILKPVDALSYEDNRGLCAEVDGKRVLIGNRDLMGAHGIDMPSRDYEKKFVKDDREILYLANSGEVTAMFVLSYKTSPGIARWVEVLGRKEISLLVHSTDPNITERKIAADYHYPKEFIRIIPAALRDRYAEMTAPRERAKAHVMSLEGPAVRLRALAAIHTLKRSIVTGTVLQLAGLVMGYALIAFLAFTGAIGSMGFIQMLIYQLFWAAAVLLLSNLRRI